MTESLFQTLLHGIPPCVDVGEIERRWLALANAYDVDRWMLPLPVWGHRRYDHLGQDAWDFLRARLVRAESDRPFCIYLHAPFCSSKCHFCDCYSFKLGAHRARHVRNYVNRLCNELRLWSQQGNLSRRPVSTVHMGGGTPTFLGEAALAQIAACIRAHFAVDEGTEWALESTVESLTPAMIATMHVLGFRRLHVGVQSLQAEVRDAIKRRRPVNEVLRKIEETLALGWIVSVDLVCGLPFQTQRGFAADILTLADLGVNGFSMYELLIYPQNRKWAATHGLTERSHLSNYLMFQVGAGILEARGFRKNLFNHWADPRDGNLYFTFPTRGEDCLAAGTIADGVFGDYHYRHPRYAPYMRQSANGRPGLQGGLRRTASESMLLPLTSAVLSGSIPRRYAAQICSLALNHWAPLERWQRHGLVQATPFGDFDLTPSGSWFAGNMVRELADACAPGLNTS